jgi:hypothetical protein
MRKVPPLTMATPSKIKYLLSTHLILLSVKINKKQFTCTFLAIFKRNV